MSFGDDEKKQNWWEQPVDNATGQGQTPTESVGGPEPESPAVAASPETPGQTDPAAPAEPSNAPDPNPPVWQAPPASPWQPPTPPFAPGWPPQPQVPPPPAIPGWQPQAGPGWQPQPAPGWQQNTGWQTPPPWSPPPAPAWQPPQPNQSWQQMPPAGPPYGSFPSGARSGGRARNLAVVALCLISFAGGMVFDHSAFPAQSDSNAASTPVAAGPTASLKNANLYNEALNIVRQNFVGKSGLTDQQLLYGSIKGMVDSLGDTGHSVFLSPQEYKDFMSSLSAQIAGIGVVMSDAGDQTIIRVLSGSPAEKGGVKAGDKITAIDGTATTGWTLDQLRTKIRGTAGTTLTLTVIHSSTTDPVDIPLTRATISIPLVQWGMVPGTHVADIVLSEFSDGASDQLKTAVTAATAAGATSIVLDLRGNPGGYAAQAQTVASEFLDGGTVYITEDATGAQTQNKADPNLKVTDLPLVVLVDHDSASSAEIVAGALQDASRAKIVGVATFGTGTVLQQFTLSDGSAIFLGVEYWLTPSGHKIFGVGITPDEKVAMPTDAYPTDPNTLAKMSASQFAASTDAELLAAVKDLNK